MGFVEFKTLLGGSAVSVNLKQITRFKPARRGQGTAIFFAAAGDESADHIIVEESYDHVKRVIDQNS